MTFAPLVSRSTPSAAIFSPTMPTSPVNEPAGVTTFPPFTTTLYVMRVPRWSPRAAPKARRGVCIWLLVPTNSRAQSSVDHIDRIIDVSFRDAHRRLDPQHVSIHPALSNEHRHLACGLQQI